jgi:hypothetical protein
MSRSMWSLSEWSSRRVWYLSHQSKISLIRLRFDEYKSVAHHPVAPAAREKAVACVPVLGDPHPPADDLERHPARAAQAEEVVMIESQHHAGTLRPARAPQQRHVP